MVLPQVVSRDQWLTARRALLAREEQLPPRHAAVVAARRRLPMVRIEKDYVFEGARGPATLPELFEGCRQLIVFHLMFDPDWDDACPSCSAFSGRLHPGLLASMRTRGAAGGGGGPPPPPPPPAPPRGGGGGVNGVGWLGWEVKKKKNT
ncbi:DUF899 family protein, partial [Micromonospora sp. NPDC000663]|uniref:DUF899 family protein n=1 Tax=Micromonospora sp. NPDC000663 TaxID=3364218 RepID=UPI00369C48F0